MTGTETLASLPPAREHLVRLMQEINFGEIKGLIFQEGEPIFNPPPRILRNIKFGGENKPRPETTKQDFILKAKICDLFAHLEILGSGTINSLKIKEGLPVVMTIEEDADKHGSQLPISD